jgi:hypothetical protein
MIGRHRLFLSRLFLSRPSRCSRSVAAALSYSILVPKTPAGSYAGRPTRSFPAHATPPRGQGQQRRGRK